MNTVCVNQQTYSKVRGSLRINRRNLRPLPTITLQHVLHCSYGITIGGVNIRCYPDEGEISDTGDKTAQCWLQAEAHVATITPRGVSIREPLQKPACLWGNRLQS